MMIYYIREKLMDVLKTAYPQEYKKYSNFYVDVVFKQQNASFSKYSYSQRKITVNTLSRSSGAIFLSYVIRLCEHIDIIQRKETHYDEQYRSLLRKLLDAALKQGIVDPKDLHSLPDKLKQDMQKRYGSFSNWDYKSQVPASQVYIRVYDSIMIANILRNNGYYFDSDQLCWEKKIELPDPDEEVFLYEYKLQADFQTLKWNRFEVTPVYKLCLVTYSKDHADYLKSLNYRHDKGGFQWYKIIFASDYNKELEFLKDVPQQRFFVTRNAK